MIACSRMYNVMPEARAGWDAIFEWVAERSGVALEVIAHPAPAPIEALWARDDMGCVFMCGWPYAMAAPRPRLVAAPVPSPDRYGGGKAVYFTDLVVRRDSPYRKLQDTFGGRIAWTLETSHSGYNALRHHLLKYRSPARPTLYACSVGPLVSPIRALQSLIDDAADVAPVDSLCLDLLRKHAPEKVAQLRVIATTAAAPMPPLVASPGTDQAGSARVTRALLTAHDDPTLDAALESVLIERFAAVAPAYYDATALLARAALDAGYPVPA